MNCEVRLEIPVKLLTENEKQKHRWERAEEWVLPSQLEFSLPQGSNYLIVIYRTKEKSYAGQFVQTAYDYFEDQERQFPDIGWGEYRVLADFWGDKRTTRQRVRY